MAHSPDLCPEARHLFDGSPQVVRVALAIETTIHDVSPTGDEELALALGRVRVDGAPPPSEVPTFVSVTDRTITTDNPPYLRGEWTVDPGETLQVTGQLDSELELLIDPPVTVSFSGAPSSVIETIERTLADIYRTRGRYLEQIDAGVVTPRVDD